MNIEERNLAIIRAHERPVSNSPITTRGTVNHELLAAVLEHRKEWGTTSPAQLLKQLVETDKWTRTVKPQ